MQKCEGAVIHMNHDKLKVLFGTDMPVIRVKEPFADKIIYFLSELSQVVLEDKEARQYADIVTFAFWIRKANVLKMKAEARTDYMRLGKGLVFHIAPSNVPINFMYTFAFGLLAGNSNIVRVSSKEFIQYTILNRILKSICMRDEYRWVGEENGIVAYPYESTDYNDYYSNLCSVRVIWGGDASIEQIRKSKLMPRSVEITFADRYSFGIVSAMAVLGSTDDELNKLAHAFYNDTFLMDQNACSTPHLIYWMGSDEEIQQSKEIFWSKVQVAAHKYDLTEMKVSEKYLILCEKAISFQLGKVRQYGNALYVVDMDEMPMDITDIRGKFGLFFEKNIKSIEEILPYTTEKIQTCVTYGIDNDQLVKTLVSNSVHGIDRVVSFGKALNIGIIWDGYEIINEFSRIIICE